MTVAPSRSLSSLVLLAVGIVLAAAATPAAAAPAASLAEARQVARELLVDLAHGRVSLAEARARGGETPSLETLAAPAEKGRADRIVGTWVVHVPGDAPFDALQTFDLSETFVETSSLLGGLAEGPAHGAWRPDGGQVVLTFELFAFEDGAAVGRIRVRARIVPRKNRFDAQSAVDVILPDGEVIPEVASGPFSGVRVIPQAP